MAVKDEYTFDFAELSPEYSEHELEIQLVNYIRAFYVVKTISITGMELDLLAQHNYSGEGI